MSDQHEAIIRRYYHDVFCAEKVDVTEDVTIIDHSMIDGFVAQNLRPTQDGGQGCMCFSSMFAASFSDMQNIVIRDLITSSDKVVIRWSWQVRHTAEFMGAPATHRWVTIKGIDIFRLADGGIADLWQEIDLLGILQQIMAPPLPEPMKTLSLE